MGEILYQSEIVFVKSPNVMKNVKTNDPLNVDYE